MVFGTQTTVGVDISTSPEQANSPNFVIGYKRKELVWMPLFLNGIDSHLLKYKQQGFYVSGHGSSIQIPAGSPDVTLSESMMSELPKGTKIQLDSTTELLFTEGSTIATSKNSGDIVLKANQKITIPANSIIQDSIGVSYQGIDLHNAKYMSKSRDAESQKSDTYSVLATFGSDIKASKNQAGVGIAQYFATGIAAQNLTLKGGADLVTVRTVDVKANDKLEEEVSELKKKNSQLLEENIGAKKAQEIRELVGEKIKVQDAKVIIIGDFFTKNDGTFNKSLLDATVDSIPVSKLPTALKNRIKTRISLQLLISNLKNSDFMAIDPIYEAIQ
jgi:hypothetical protein